MDAGGLGSPDSPLDEGTELERRLAGRRARVPIFVCTGRHVVRVLEREGRLDPLEAAGVTIVADTCVVVTPILPDPAGDRRVLMTNSGKFAHYGPANTGYEAIYGSLADCVESAVAGRVVRDETLWQ